MRRNQLQTYAELHHDADDPWGSAVTHAFGIGMYLYAYRGAQPGDLEMRFPFDPDWYQHEDDYREDFSDASDEELWYTFRVLKKYAALAKSLGKDY